MLKNLLNQALVIVGCVAVLLAAGCGQKASETVAEKIVKSAMGADGQNVDMDIDGDSGDISMTVKDDEGKERKINISSDGGSGSFSMSMDDDGSDNRLDIKGSEDGDDVTMTMKTEEGVMTMVSGANASIPPDFPKDVPQFPGWTLTMVQTMPGHGSHIVAASAKPVSEVAAYYKEQCGSQGWTEQMSMNQGGMQMLNYQKGERVLQVILNSEGSGAQINLTTAMQ